MLAINSICSSISNIKISTKPISITCASCTSHISVFSVVITMAYNFSYKDKKVILLDYSSNKSKPIIKFLDKIIKEDTNNTKIINVNPNITYVNVLKIRSIQESLDINLDKLIL